MVDFVCQGSVQGKQYGVHGMGTGRMPAFCQTKPYNPDSDLMASQPHIATRSVRTADRDARPGSARIAYVRGRCVADTVPVREGSVS